ncbi:NADH-quinone oxidoreductase subunit L [Hoyosella sp. G463]|uniref:NADH-quinone oxidoreductase subunit L n=1 Tax=Lolliginicoccus lacisalsi TaxID=2742202 RepID=A0A927JBP3_9ACTN|nr:NADH-quinone oxidoreductase subunit L [Lolliginicoccus lacisalsi]MBD8506200.1 NADH-quinone oxidoreductase subunit L [Lolliginicoccus lacisalsi]
MTLGPALLTALPLLPLLGAAILLLSPAVTAGAASTDERRAAWGPALACAAAISSFAVALVLLVDLLGRPGEDRTITHTLFTWVPVADLRIGMGLLLDPLSMSFVLLITGVGSLIHIYSLGYMSHDPGRRRFFAYLNLFLAAMLVLVLADNYLGLYLGWEGVGLASYLLIGFWAHKPSAATAAKKAFIINRVGDTGLAIAMMILIATFGSLAFDVVFASAPEAGTSTLTAIGLLLLLAACGKSAQVPLQAWLGDAMEGPTPVSALIHAATMVTAGVYLVIRSGPLIEPAPIAGHAIVTVGAVTLLFGAIIGCAKDDIKKALAASTMSQIGYMMLAAGLGPAGYAFALMHLITHGFFKAGLFLGAGSVMHAMNDETDMRRFGGLRAAMPLTFLTFGAGYLAIIGVPPFAGFFSKDKIIEVAFAADGISGIILGSVTLLGAALTAYYMTRGMLMTFLGAPRWAEDQHPHESPASMTGPMIILALGSVAAGGFLALGDRFAHWLEPVIGSHHPEPRLPIWATTSLALAAVAIGVLIAYRQHAAHGVPITAPTSVSMLTRAARRDLHGDTINEALLERPGRHLARGLAAADTNLLARAVSSVGALSAAASRMLRTTQTGYARSYALAMLAGSALILAAFWIGGVR